MRGRQLLFLQPVGFCVVGLIAVTRRFLVIAGHGLFRLGGETVDFLWAEDSSMFENFLLFGRERS